jgi:hypothetical protein
MKTKLRYIAAFSALVFAITVFFPACEEESTGPETVPIKAEIKQIIVLNSVHTIDYLDKIPEDIDTVEITVPQGTDISQLDLDIIVSYFGTIVPEPGITDLTNPVTYTVTSNFETRDILVMAVARPPSLTSFLLTSPLEVPGRIVKDTTGLGMDTIRLKIEEGIDLSKSRFLVEFFGESVDPDPSGTIDLEVENPTLDVVNKDFRTTYAIYIERFKEIRFTGFIYDGTVHPNEILPRAISSEDSAFITIEDDESALGGKVARFTNLEYSGNATGSVNFDYGNLGLTDQPEEITVIMRGKGYPTFTENFRYVEIVVQLGFGRFQFWVTDDGLDGTDYGNLAYEDIPGGFDPLSWNTYRLTAKLLTGEVKIYLNESPDPLAEMSPLFLGPRDSESWRASFGDGSGGNAYDGSYDYFIIETGGAYSPTQLPLSKIFIEE